MFEKLGRIHTGSRIAARNDHARRRCDVVDQRGGVFREGVAGQHVDQRRAAPESAPVTGPSAVAALAEASVTFEQSFGTPPLCVALIGDGCGVDRTCAISKISK